MMFNSFSNSSSSRQGLNSIYKNMPQKSWCQPWFPGRTKVGQEPQITNLEPLECVVFLLVG